MTPTDTAPALLQLAPQDNCAIACRALPAGRPVAWNGTTITPATDVPTGHKVALVAIAAGEKVLRHGAPIGSATRAIAVGEHVHTHNLRSDYLPTYTLDDTHRFIDGAQPHA